MLSLCRRSVALSRSVGMRHVKNVAPLFASASRASSTVSTATIQKKETAAEKLIRETREQAFLGGGQLYMRVMSAVVTFFRASALLAVLFRVHLHFCCHKFFDSTPGSGTKPSMLIKAATQAKNVSTNSTKKAN